MQITKRFHDSKLFSKPKTLELQVFMINIALEL